jgi:hypothetical protein
MEDQVKGRKGKKEASNAFVPSAIKTCHQFNILD